MPRLARLMVTALSAVLLTSVLSGPALADAGPPVVTMQAWCVGPGGTTTARGSYRSANGQPADGTIAWVATGRAGVVDRGTVVLADGEGGFTIDDLAFGTYDVAFTPAGDTVPSIASHLTVIDCITAEVSCKAVTFTNPAANPSVEIEYSPPFDADSPDEDGMYVEVPPGEQVTRRTGLDAIGWLTIVWIKDGETYQNLEAGSNWNLPIPHDCDRPLSSLTRSCVKHHPRLNIRFAREGSDQPIRFGVTDAKGRSVGRVSPKNVRTKATVKLPGPGRYTYKSYFEFVKAYEEIPFRIKTCGGHR